MDRRGTRATVRSEDAMRTAESPDPFRGLPLTPEQDSEIRHYIHHRERSGLPWDTPELAAMLADMLDPPELADDDGQSVWDSTEKERSSSLDGDDVDDGAALRRD
jgi:hypothetical protein